MSIPDNKCPKTIEEAYQYLDIMDGDHKEWLKEDIDKAIGLSHHGIGQWIRNNFGLWKDKSILREWFLDNYMLDHPDDISTLILVYFHKKKNGVDTDLSFYVNKYHKHWERFSSDYKLKLRKHKLNRLCSK